MLQRVMSARDRYELDEDIDMLIGELGGRRRWNRPAQTDWLLAELIGARTAGNTRDTRDIACRAAAILDANPPKLWFARTTHLWFAMLAGLCIYGAWAGDLLKCVLPLVLLVGEAILWNRENRRRDDARKFLTENYPEEAG